MKIINECYIYLIYLLGMKKNISLKNNIKNIVHKYLNENQYINQALDNMKILGVFEKLNDIDKLVLLSGSNNIEKLKRLNLSKIYKENNGTFGRFMIKVRVKPINEQPVNRQTDKMLAGQEGWLSQYIHYTDRHSEIPNEPYVSIRFDEFESDINMRGGGSYKEMNVMLKNIYPIEFDNIKSDFKKYDDETKLDMGYDFYSQD